ncbi:MAG: secretion protein [Polyangiaceae bacterium]|nr:secretion protein [Polyangiaceae bacterium]
MAALSGACSVPVARGLDEQDANRVATALEEQGVAASKEVDPQAEGRWLVSVGPDDAPAATAVLASENLPPRPSPGVLEAMGEDALVPSRASEHARLIAGVAGDLERSLRSIDGVLSARVHLAVPVGDALALDDTRPPPTASVLLRHRGATPPVSVQGVQQLVARAVPALSPEMVSVVATPVPPAKRAPERELARFGPITVTQGTSRTLRAIVGLVIVLNLALIGLLVALWSRLRRAQATLLDMQSNAGMPAPPP